MGQVDLVGLLWAKTKIFRCNALETAEWKYIRVTKEAADCIVQLFIWRIK